MPEKDLQNTEWIESRLDALGMVRWDRFTVEPNTEVGQIINVYGWIDRDEDNYKDFVLVRFMPETSDNYMWYVTSSAEYTETISNILFGDDVDHVDCQRVEDSFDVEDTTAITKTQ